MEKARWFDSSLQGSAGKVTLQNILKRCVSVLVLLNTRTLLLCISISSPLSAVFLACQGLIHVLPSVHDISNHLLFPCKAGCSFNHWVQISADLIMNVPDGNVEYRENLAILFHCWRQDYQVWELGTTSLAAWQFSKDWIVPKNTEGCRRRNVIADVGTPAGTMELQWEPKGEDDYVKSTVYLNHRTLRWYLNYRTS